MDPFNRFLALLTAHLDDHEIGSNELAAQLYISRSVLDRLVRAAAGEAPERLRRRILLERAAYALVTTDATILHVADAAGYSSHEAFGRAFARSYGRPPAAWRSAPGPIHLGATNVHFHPPGGLRLSVAERTTMNFPAELVTHHTAVIGRLIDRARTLTTERIDSPIDAPGGIDNDPTIRSVLARLVGQMHMWTAAMANEPYDVAAERDWSLEIIEERLHDIGPRFVAYVRDMADTDRLGETFVDATGERPYAFTAAGMVAHILTYAAYRRTVVTAALTTAGAGEIDDDPLNWFTP